MQLRRQFLETALCVSIASCGVHGASIAAEGSAPNPHLASINQSIHEGIVASEAGRFTDAMARFQKGIGVTQGRAEFLIGGLVAEGSGVPKDYAAAKVWFQRSADQGFVGGMESLADLYRHGWGVRKNLSEALRWRKAGADTGEPLAMLGLARSYELGWDGQTNLEEAIRWYRVAAERGNLDARAALNRLKAPDR